MIWNRDRGKARRSALARRSVQLEFMEDRSLMSETLGILISGIAVPASVSGIRADSLSQAMPGEEQVVLDSGDSAWSSTSSSNESIARTPQNPTTPTTPAPPTPGPGTPTTPTAPEPPKFNTPEEAAKDWGEHFNGPSILEGQEYGSTIYQTPDGKYSYTPPNKGGNAGVTPSRPTGGETVVADIHSHGKWEAGYDNNHFSQTDIDDNERQNIPGYLTTPDGSFQVYKPGDNSTTVISTDMQSDPNDPDRKNTKNPKPLATTTPTTPTTAP